MTFELPDSAKGSSLSYEKELTISSTAPDVAVNVLPRISALTVQAYISSGSAEYEVLATANNSETVRAGTARWFSLFGGMQTASKQVCIPAKVSYLRFVRVSGTVEIALYGS